MSIHKLKRNRPFATERLELLSPKLWIIVKNNFLLFRSYLHQSDIFLQGGHMRFFIKNHKKERSSKSDALGVTNKLKRQSIVFLTQFKSIISHVFKLYKEKHWTEIG